MERRLRLLGAVGTGLLLVALFLVGIVYAATVTIDTFDEGLIDLETATVGRVSDDATDAGILGTEHSVCLTKTSGNRAVAASIDKYDTDQFAFSSESGTFGDACITWDGNDGQPEVLDKEGLGGVDLTDNGTNDGIQLLVPFTDGDFDLTIRVFSGTQESDYTLQLRPTGILSDATFFVPFTDFTAVSGGGVDFASVGAIQFAVVPLEAAVDLETDLLEATAQTDWGDLPESGTSYATSDANNGPRHVRGDLYLGDRIDLEADGFSSTNADGDDNNNFGDEDGIMRVKVEDGGDPWDDGDGTGHISATVTGGTGDLYAWFDWNNDGDFGDANEAQSWTGLSAGEHRLTVTVEDSAFDPTNGLYARFRLVSQGAGDPGVTGEVTNGEVEDYYWGSARWDTNVVTLKDLDVQSTGFSWALGALALVLTAGAGALVLRRRCSRV